MLQAAVEEELATIIALFSHWDPRSELSRFNAAPAGVWALSHPFWLFLDEAMDLAGETRGACDPTLGALVNLWGFGPPGPRPAHDPIPTDEEIEAAMAVSGRWKLRFNRDARAAIQPGGLKLDFSAIAKGHALDRVSDRLIREGATSHLVEIGGELKGVGVKPDLQPWWVEIEQPSRTAIRAAHGGGPVRPGGGDQQGITAGPSSYDGRTVSPIPWIGSTPVRPVKTSNLTSVTVLHASGHDGGRLRHGADGHGAVRRGPDYAEAAGSWPARTSIERTRARLRSSG